MNNKVESETVYTAGHEHIQQAPTSNPKNREKKTRGSKFDLVSAGQPLDYNGRRNPVKKKDLAVETSLRQRLAKLRYASKPWQKRSGMMVDPWRDMLCVGRDRKSVV